MNRIFIGIPTLNRPDYVRESIQSVLQQDYQDFLILVSDNVSSPENQQSVRAYIQGLNDPRVTYYQQTYNIGEYGQGRYFFSQAKNSDYFMILHDDDCILPGYLKKAVEVLDKKMELAYFVANPYIIDKLSKRSLSLTDAYLKRHARNRTAEGIIDVLKTHLSHDFTPVSGTFFRYTALQQSGFVDAERYGLFPFEANIYLRLGDINARAWFCPDELLAFRFHAGALRNKSIVGNFHILENLIHLYKERRFNGKCEHIRVQSLGRLYREKAIYYIKSHQSKLSVRPILDAVKTFPFSPKTLLTVLLVGFAQLFPGIAKRFLSELPLQFTDKELDGFKRGINMYTTDSLDMK